MALLGASPRQFKVAAVGTATAAAVGGADLIPNVQTGRSLGESFPTGHGRILLAVAESAGTDFEVAARGTIMVRPASIGESDVMSQPATASRATCAARREATSNSSCDAD